MSGKELYLKLEVFVLTFLSYVSIHALRTAYSYSKYHIMTAIEADKSMLGTCKIKNRSCGYLHATKFRNRFSVSSF
jgi:sugar phosphate permease